MLGKDSIGMGFGMGFGILCAPIQDQLKEQGYILHNDNHHRKKTREQYMEDMRVAFNNLRVSGFLTESEADKVANRMIKYIAKHLKPTEGRGKNE